MNTFVKKRNGKLEEFMPEKINKVLEWACENISDVSPSDIAMNAQMSVENKMKTSDIQEIMIQSASNLITEEAPNYQYVAARLKIYALRKQVWGESEPPRLYDHLRKNKKNYDEIILESYSESEIHKINKFIRHDRDYLFTYAGIQQMCDKYLICDRTTGELFETPQFVFILIPMILFRNYENRIEMIKTMYNYLSLFKINLPTPVLAGVRTPLKYYASCVLADCDDSLDSIFTTAHIIGKYTARRSGIGVNMGRIRAVGSPIRKSEVISTGIIPYLKIMESAVKATSQNGLRGGGATVSFPWWHYESDDILVLKNNRGTDDNRVRKLDYCIQLDSVFIDRVVNNKNITLFCPNEAKGLYDAFGTDNFKSLYEEYENNTKIKLKKIIPARELATSIAKERLETGRIYVMFMDNANKYSPWKNKINMGNLCVEILQPTIPSKSVDDNNSEIGICILSAINVLETKDEELQDVCKYIVYSLNELIDYQLYPFEAARKFCQNKRSLGVGITNFAALLASKKLNHNDTETVKVTNDLCEKIQYYLLEASCEMAEKFGPAQDFNCSKYSEKFLPADYKSEFNLQMDWENLRNKISQFGLRNCTLTAQMPCESSSVVQCSTNGIEPIRSILTKKSAKNGELKVLVPRYPKYKNEYVLAFDIENNDTLIKIAAAMQRWFDMGISFNTYLNYKHYPDGKIPISIVLKDIINAHKNGLKTMYYNNTPDDSEENSAKENCAGGACSI